MRILIINNHTKHLKELQKICTGHTIHTKTYTNRNTNDTKNIDCIILSGWSKYNIFHKSFTKEKKLILNIQKPLIGICLWAQLIAYTYGAQIKKMHHKFYGLYDISIQKRKKSVFEAHKFYIHDIPDTLEKLWTSRIGVEYFRHKDKPQRGLQFHPEVTYKHNDGHKIFDNILEQIQTLCPKQ